MSISQYYETLNKLSVREIHGQAVPESNWSESMAEQFAIVDGPIPPLEQQVFPGDTVVIAIAANVPKQGEIVRKLVTLLQSAGVSSENISVVSTLTAPPQWEAAVPWFAHDSDNPEVISMVGVSRNGEQLYVNTRLADADVVVPVVLAGNGQASSGYLYPALSSTQTQNRLQEDLSLLIEEAKEAEQFVSPFFVVGIVPAPGDRIGQIIVDVRSQVDRIGAASRPKYWTADMNEHQAVVGTLGSEISPVDIVALLKGVQNVSQMVQTRGPIVLLAYLTTKKRAADQNDERFDVENDELESDTSEGQLSPEDREYVDLMELGQDERESSDVASAGRDDDDLGEYDFGDEDDSQSQDSEDHESEDDAVDEYTDGTDELTEAKAGYFLGSLLDDLRSHQPVFLVSNLTSTQTEALGFGTLSTHHDLETLLKNLDDVGILKDAERWEIR